MKNNILFLIIIAGGLFIYQTYFSSSDKKEINSIIEDLHQSLEYKGILPPLAVVSRLKTIQSLLSSDFNARSISDDKERTLSDVKKVKENALLASRYFSDIEITKMPYLVEVKGAYASATFNTIISGKSTQGGKFKELFDIKMEFSKQDGKWYCSSLNGERLTPDE